MAKIPAKVRVLIISDDATGAEALADMLTMHRCLAKFLPDGAEVGKHIARFRPTCIVLDTALPPAAAALAQVLASGANPQPTCVALAPRSETAAWQAAGFVHIVDRLDPTYELLSIVGRE